MHWRYRCLAESALVMLLPLLDGASGAAVARHWAGAPLRFGSPVHFWVLLGFCCSAAPAARRPTPTLMLNLHP